MLPAGLRRCVCWGGRGGGGGREEGESFRDIPKLPPAGGHGGDSHTGPSRNQGLRAAQTHRCLASVTCTEAEEGARVALLPCFLSAPPGHTGTQPPARARVLEGSNIPGAGRILSEAALSSDGGQNKAVYTYNQQILERGALLVMGDIWNHEHRWKAKLRVEQNNIESSDGSVGTTAPVRMMAVYCRPHAHSSDATVMEVQHRHASSRKLP